MCLERRVGARRYATFSVATSLTPKRSAGLPTKSCEPIVSAGKRRDRSTESFELSVQAIE